MKQRSVKVIDGETRRWGERERGFDPAFDDRIRHSPHLSFSLSPSP